MTQSSTRPSACFAGCQLSILLNGLNVLTIDEGVFIQSVLSFIAQQEIKQAGKEKRTAKAKEGGRV